MKERLGKLNEWQVKEWVRRKRKGFRKIIKTKQIIGRDAMGHASISTRSLNSLQLKSNALEQVFFPFQVILVQL